MQTIHPFTGMMKNLRVVAGDPGRTNDPFGVVGLEATWPDKKIFVRYAKQFKGQPYGFVATWFNKMNLSILPDMILIEKNFEYDDVSAAFSKYDLDIKYITTSTNLTEKTRAKGWSVDKNYMIGWLKDEYKYHSFQWPENPSDDMRELINQRNQIVGITGPSGHTTYKAVRNRHDDLFMAKLIGSNAIRIWWEQLDQA